jgi:hypothetical protein
MEMHMEPELLAPGVKDGREARLGTETFPACGQFDEGLGGSLEKEVIETFSVS